MSYYNNKEEAIKRMYPYLYDLVCKGKIKIEELVNNGGDNLIIKIRYDMVNEDLWDTIYIKEGDIGESQFEFFTQNNYGLGINYYSNSIGNRSLPATMAFLIKKISATISILIKDDLKFKIDIAQKANGIMEITIPEYLQEIIDNILYKTTFEFVYSNCRMLSIPLSDIAVISNMPTISTMSDYNSPLVFHFGIQEEQIKEFDRYFFLPPYAIFNFTIKFPYELKLSKGVLIKLKLHGNKFNSV